MLICRIILQDGRPVFGVEVGEVYSTLDHATAWPPQHHHHSQPKRFVFLNLKYQYHFYFNFY